MQRLNPWATGGALSLTAAAIYVLCALAVRWWPDGTVEFFGYWFHGIDLRAIQTGAAPGGAALLVGLVSLMLAAFAAGALFAGCYNGLARLAGGAR